MWAGKKLDSLRLMMRHAATRNQEFTTIVSQVEREEHGNKKGIKTHFS